MYIIRYLSDNERGVLQAVPISWKTQLKLEGAFVLISWLKYRKQAAGIPKGSDPKLEDPTEWRCEASN